MECRLGLIQLAAGDDKTANLQAARREIDRVVRKGAELVILPEMFCVPYETSRFADYAEAEGGEAQQMLAAAAKENGCWLVGGSICEEENGHYYNTSYVYNPQGVCVAKHRKMHLFDIDIEGGQYFKESDVLSPGTSLTVFDTPWGRVGLAICFDIRFADMAAAMVDAGAQLLRSICPRGRATGSCCSAPGPWMGSVMPLVWRRRVMRTPATCPGGTAWWSTHGQKWSVILAQSQRHAW